MSRQPTVDELRALFTGQDPTDQAHLVAVRPGDVFARGSVAPVLDQSFTELPSGLLIPTSAARRPAPIDSVWVYLTAEEVLGESVSLRDVAAFLAGVTMEEAVSWASYWIAELEKPGADRRKVDEQFVTQYLSPEAAARTRGLLSGERRVLLTQQALLLLSKIALCVCRRRVDGEADGKALPLVAALLGLAQNMGADPESDDEAEWVVTKVPGPLGREMIANQLFNSGQSESGVWAMFQRCWRELPQEQADHPRVLDLAAEYKRATGVSLDDVGTICAALWAAAASGRPTAMLTYFDSLGWEPERLEGVLSLIAADPATHAQMLAQEVDEFGAQWSTRSLAEFPVVRWEDRLTVLHPRLLIERAAGRWPMLDILRALEGADRPAEASRVRQCVQHLSEVYALEAVQGIVGGGTGRFYSEDDLRKAYGRKVKVADAAVDYGHAWVVVEVTCTGHAHATAAGLNDDGPVRDIDTYVRKAEQLQATIDSLRADECGLTAGQSVGRARRFYPVLVVADRVAVGPIFMTLLRERLEAVGLLQGHDVEQLEVCEIEDLDVLEGLVEEGGPGLLTHLEEKPKSGMRDMGLKNYILAELGRSPGRPARVNQRWHAWFDTALEQLSKAS